MSFLTSKTIIHELDEIEYLQSNIEILQEIIDTGTASKETYESYFEQMFKCLEKQRVLWTRLQYETDDEVTNIRCMIEEQTILLGRSPNVPVSTYLSELSEELSRNITDAREWLKWY